MLTNYIRKSIDYLILNAYSVKNIGFYNGKAGLSLCLFEIARYLEEEQIEEHAFELLQESLALGDKKNDISYENGLSGIGFVLLYLINNQFINADFEELFGEYAKIILSAMELKEFPIGRFFFQLHFLTVYYRLTKDEKINSCITVIIKEIEEKLEKQINESDLNKHLFLNEFTDYLKVISVNNYPVSFPVIERYCHLFRRGKLISSFEIAFYLKHLIRDKENAGFLSETIEINKKYNLQNLKLNSQFYSLSQRINLLFLLRQNPEIYHQQIGLLEQDLFGQSDDKDFQKMVLLSIPRNKYIPGYESGIARLLLYFVYREQEKERKDVRRFNSLFL